MVNMSLNGKISGKILNVEDAPVVRNLLTEILVQQGHQVVSATDGFDAIRHVEKENYDLVISDIHMPGLDGLQLISRIKEIQPSLPIIIVTADPTIDKAIDAIKQGASDFISKPFQIDRIREVVQKNLREKQLIMENQHLLAEVNNKAVIEQLNRQLHQKVNQLTKLYTISESFQSFADNSSMFQHIVDLAGELTSARRVSLMSFDPSRNFLVIRAAIGLTPEVQQSTYVELGHGVAGRVARCAQLLRVTSQQNSKSNTVASRVRYTSQSWLSVPLFIGDEIFGVLNLTDKNDGSDFTKEDEFLVLILAEKAGIKIENNALYEGIYTNLIDTLKTLVSTIEAKDPYTRYHSQRVTETALALARHVKCSEEDCESIAFAGILHDIGKIGIEDRILLKPGQLNPKEYEIIKRHPVVGDVILQPLGLIEAERQIIRHHHERVDGTGYPDHLPGSQISNLSRIVSIADAVDAMVSIRSYRKAMAVSDVIEELRNNAGKQFDGDLVYSMIDTIKAGEVDFRWDARVSEEGPDTPLADSVSFANPAKEFFFTKVLKKEFGEDDKQSESRTQEMESAG